MNTRKAVQLIKAGRPFVMNDNLIMMKKILWNSVALLVLGCLCGCQEGGYNLQGKVTGPQFNGKTVYLCEVSGSALDSVVVKDSRFGFNLPDTAVTVYNLLLKDKQVDILPLSIPVVAGDGVARVTMGDVLAVQGTPLNDALYEILVGIDELFGEAMSGKIGAEEARAKLRQYLKDKVVKNKANILSVYLLKSYRSRFTAEEYEQLVQQLDKRMASCLK